MTNAPVKRKRPHVPARRGYVGTIRADRKHAQQVGTILVASNRAHSSLFSIFQHAVVGGDYKLAHAMWHSISSDRGQRLLLLAAIEVKRQNKQNKDGKLVLDGIHWGAKSLEKLSEARNAAAHAEMLCYEDIMEPGISTSPSVVARLDRFPIDKNWRKITGDLNALAEYLFVLSMDLASGKPRPSCRRPRLQSLHSESAEAQERNRQAKKAARERERQSSRQ